METNDISKKRHTLAHLLAAAVLEQYPDTKLTLGPAIDTGFYYDMEFSKPLTDADLPKIEKVMRKLLPSWTEFTHREVSVDEAKSVFAGNPYKLELIEEIAEKGEKITLYTCGGFTDLCRGGHLDNPAQEIDTESFKLDKLAGAYWRGDENNKMLTRVYGLAFENKSELDSHLKLVEEAKERDHRKIGKELNLFTFSELVGAGLPLWTPRGHKLREALTDRLWNISRKYGYEKVTIPHIAKLALYETSGHAAKFKDEFFYVRGAQSGDEFVFKPMNCPHHTQIYAAVPHSYRDLPIRLNELTMMYRDEKPGQLLGLSRVRSISVDDAHIFCTPDQIKDEVRNIVKTIEEFYSALGMYKKGETFWVSLSVRDPKTPEKYLGTDENWAKAENFLQEISDEFGLDAKRMPGEAAFYGPKLDFQFKDALGRERQLATAQIDFVQPERFGLEYTAKDGTKQTPVMIHRAIAGSLERFLAIMIEHFAGNFPFWLAPVQIAIVPIKEDTHGEFAKGIYEKMTENGVRAELMTAGLGKSVREAKNQKVPFIMVIGDKEIESNKFKLEGRVADEGGEEFSDVSLEDIFEKFSKLNKI